MPRSTLARAARLAGPRRSALLWAATALIVLATPAALALGYYAVRKLSFPYEFCGAYGELDGELGWRLKPGARSCLRGRNRWTGESYFDSTIVVDLDGFRSADPAGRAARGGIVAIGDSWTFGYGLDLEGSYPHALSQLVEAPVANMAVPAYGSAQVLLWLERRVAELAPRAVVYLTLGLWQRSLCGEDDAVVLLAPCFRPEPVSGRITLVTPEPGRVLGMATRGIYPGGYLTAGVDSWSYFLISRPVLVARAALARLGRRLGFGPTGAERESARGAVLAFELERHLALARRHGYVVVLLDPQGDYRDAVAALAAPETDLVAYVSPERWSAEVSVPSAALPPAEQRVPQDGHFGPGANRLIAALVARVLAEAGVAP
ncbi:MAG: SGNH/GDSL hydrolase family protein [Alphaproteobacteria bacterium]